MYKLKHLLTREYIYMNANAGKYLASYAASKIHLYANFENATKLCYKNI